MATWGQEPFRSALPELLAGIARDAARAGGQWSASLFVSVALMPSGWVNVTLGPSPPGAGETPPPPQLALAWRVFQGDGRKAWKLIGEHNSPLLAAARVPDWLRG